MTLRNSAALTLLLFKLCSLTLAHEPYDVNPTTRRSEAQIQRASGEMADAAINLWNALSDDQRKAIGFPFDAAGFDAAQVLHQAAPHVMDGNLGPVIGMGE